MLAAGELPQAGLIKQEEIRLQPFLANRFGKVYAMPAPAAAHAA
jgi:saccharopine dehydrogenase-like NADP-dependent oxidoreductase